MNWNTWAGCWCDLSQSLWSCHPDCWVLHRRELCLSCRVPSPWPREQIRRGQPAEPFFVPRFSILWASIWEIWDGVRRCRRCPSYFLNTLDSIIVHAAIKSVTNSIEWGLNLCTLLAHPYFLGQTKQMSLMSLQLWIAVALYCGIIIEPLVLLEAPSTHPLIVMN